MSEAKLSKGTGFMLFLVSLVACIAFLIFLPEWFWVTLPTLLTGLVSTFDAI